ncbi:hypothetical protein GQR58_024194 [Nymphon striatum]|nr:hypothetical protein GQR58_024194 [Nymphon striatum]
MTDRAKLKRLQVETSVRTILIDATVIDGSAFIWIPNWPTKGTVADLSAGFKSLIEWRLRHGDVYLIFYRYLNFSTKSAARSGRASGVGKIHYLTTINSELPAKEVSLNVDGNNKQLIGLIDLMYGLQKLHKLKLGHLSLTSYHQPMSHSRKMLNVPTYKPAYGSNPGPHTDSLDPELFGFKKEERTLQTITVPDNVAFAPKDISDILL